MLSDLSACSVIHSYVITDQTQQQCSEEHQCPLDTECPLHDCFTGYEVEEIIIEKS